MKYAGKKPCLCRSQLSRNLCLKHSASPRRILCRRLCPSPTPQKGLLGGCPTAQLPSTAVGASNCTCPGTLLAGAGWRASLISTWPFPMAQLPWQEPARDIWGHSVPSSPSPHCRVHKRPLYRGRKPRYQTLNPFYVKDCSRRHQPPMDFKFQIKL